MKDLKNQQVEVENQISRLKQRDSLVARYMQGMLDSTQRGAATASTSPAVGSDLEAVSKLLEFMSTQGRFHVILRIENGRCREYWTKGT